MADDLHPPGPSETDMAMLAEFATALADGIDAALPGWVALCVLTRLDESGIAPPADLAEQVRAAGAEAQQLVVADVRTLLALDVEQQAANPLAIVRRAVAVPTALLAGLGVRPVARDVQAQDLFPDDVYDLMPTGFADLHPDLREPGLMWGAAKAHVIMARRRALGG